MYVVYIETLYMLQHGTVHKCRRWFVLHNNYCDEAKKIKKIFFYNLPKNLDNFHLIFRVELFW